MKKITHSEDIAKLLNERSVGSFDRLFETLGKIIEARLNSELVYFFVKEDLLPEMQLSWGSPNTLRSQQDQYFYHLKSFVYQCLEFDPQVLENVSIPLLDLKMSSMIVYPVYFGDGKRGVWLIANPLADVNMYQNSDLETLDLILSECFPVLEQLKLKQTVRVYQQEQQLATRLNKLIDSNYDFDTFLKHMREIIEDTAQCQSVLFLMYNDMAGQFYLEAGNAEGCEFWANQEDFFKGLARQSETQGVFAKTYSGRNFQGEKYGLDRLETCLVLPLKFYDRVSGAFILLNKSEQQNFNETDVRLMNIIIRTSKSVIFRERERNSIVSLFEKFVSDKIVREVLEHQDSGLLSEQRREITVLFIDLNGFTSITESESPTVVIQQLNQFLTEMTEQVFQYGGTLDKYIGDEIMAIFGSPITLDNHAQRAVECALAMQDRMRELSKLWSSQNKSELTASIGIATGVSLVGTIGCDKYMDYTAIGDIVNTASRITEAADHDTIFLEASTVKLIEPVAILKEPVELHLKGKQKIVYASVLERLKTEQELQKDLDESDDHSRIDTIRCLGLFRHYAQTTLVRNYLNDPILAVRQQSLKTISRLDRQEDVDYLLEQLDKESEEEFRQELLEVISQTSSEAVVALLKDYLGELEPDVKNLVIDAIGYDGHEENKKLLLPLLNDSNNKVRANVAHAIYRFGDVRVIEILLKMLESNENSMQVSAIDVLAKIGTTQVVQPLLKLATKAEVNDVNYAAAKALGQLTKQQSIRYLNLLSEDNPKLAQWKAFSKALSSQSDEQERFFKQALGSMNKIVVYAALTAIKRLALHGYSTELVDLINTDCEHIKEQSVLGLKPYANGVVIPVYLSCLNTCTESVTVIILREIGSRNQSQLNSVLLQYLDSQSPDIRMAAIGSLAKLKKPGTLERLLDVYQDSSNANEKATVVRALAEFPSNETGQLLEEALRSTIGRIRANAIDALVKIEGAKVLPLIEPLLEDENNRVRANAAMALHSFGQTRAYEYLDKMMGSDDKWMRLSAIWTLAEIGSVRSREIIAKHLNDSDYDVKLRAILSLNRLDRKLLTLLEEILTSREEHVESLDRESFGSPDKLNNCLIRDSGDHE